MDYGLTGSSFFSSCCFLYFSAILRIEKFFGNSSADCFHATGILKDEVNFTTIFNLLVVFRAKEYCLPFVLIQHVLQTGCAVGESVFRQESWDEITHLGIKP